MIRVLIIAAVLALSLAHAQPRAFKDIMFGDSLIEVAEKLVQHPDIRDGHTPLPQRVLQDTTPELILRYAYLVTDIGDHTYQIRFDFYDGKLYSMTFASQAYDASFFDTYVVDSARTLVDVIATNHGRAHNTVPTGFLDLRNGFIVWTHVWDTNESGADFRIGLARSGFRYYSALRIQWTWLAGLRAEAIGHDPDRDVRESAADF